jgi:peptidoglycan/xylan/chitin deacetylase (PgdA/CDA1 family)
MKKARLARWLARTGALAFVSAATRWSGVVVFNYHRLGDGERSLFDRELWSAGAEAFTDQIRCCKDHLDLIRPEDLADIRGSKRKGRYGLITFDDGYRDNYEIAFPILVSEGVPATFFVATGFVDVPRLPWWDAIAWMIRSSKQTHITLSASGSSTFNISLPNRDAAIRQILRLYKTMPGDSANRLLDEMASATEAPPLPPAGGLWMTWDMLRDMSAAGMTIGGHTVTHPVMAQASPERQAYEIVTCGRRIFEEIGVTMRAFSYPVGGPQAFNLVTRRCLEEAGVEWAFSYYGGFRSFDDWDPYDLRRVAIETYVTAEWFEAIVRWPGLFA